MEFLKKNKIVTVLAVLAIIALAYFGFTSLSAAPAISSSDAGPSPISQNLLVTLANLHTIRLDGSIFDPNKNPVFASLTDFGVVIQAPPCASLPSGCGRINPFAPSGASFVTATSTAQNTKITPKALR